MNGVVRRKQAVVPVTVIGPITGVEQTFDAVIDTGFDDYITLPLEAIAGLALPAEDDQLVMLADGSIVSTLHFTAEVIWHGGERRTILVQSAPGVPLLGMSLMAGSVLTIHIREDGEVRIAVEQ